MLKQVLFLEINTQSKLFQIMSSHKRIMETMLNDDN